MSTLLIPLRTVVTRTGAALPVTLRTVNEGDQTIYVVRFGDNAEHEVVLPQLVLYVVRADLDDFMVFEEPGFPDLAVPAGEIRALVRTIMANPLVENDYVLHVQVDVKVGLIGPESVEPF